MKLNNKIMNGLVALLFASGCETLSKINSPSSEEFWHSSLIKEKKEFKKKDFYHNNLFSIKPPLFKGITIRWNNSKTNEANKIFTCNYFEDLNNDGIINFPEEFNGFYDNYPLGENFNLIIPIRENIGKEFLVELNYFNTEKNLAWNICTLKNDENALAIKYNILIIADYEAVVKVYDNGIIGEEIARTSFSISKYINN